MVSDLNTVKHKKTAKHKKNDTTWNNDIFQAVGVIFGDIEIDKKNVISITINNAKESKKFRLKYKSVAVLQQLKKEMNKHGSKQYLIVYPVVTHFPGDKESVISFDLVGFRSRENKENRLDYIDNKLMPFQFKISGIWQFIPVCKTPCLSIFRNRTRELRSSLENIDILQKALFTKANHINIRCQNKDAMPRPYRYQKQNKEKQTYNPTFVSIIAEFDINDFTFNHVETLLQTSEIPKYYKMNKKEKAQASKIRFKTKGMLPQSSARVSIKNNGDKEVRKIPPIKKRIVPKPKLKV